MGEQVGKRKGVGGVWEGRGEGEGKGVRGGGGRGGLLSLAARVRP